MLVAHNSCSIVGSGAPACKQLLLVTTGETRRQVVPARASLGPWGYGADLDAELRQSTELELCCRDSYVE